MMPFENEAKACRAAQKEWAQRSIRERLRHVRNFRHLLADHADELTKAVENDVARLPAEVLGSDVLPLAAACQFLEKHARSLLSSRRIGGTPLFLFGQRDRVHRRPLGVVGIIGTWNYPLLLNGVQLLQALAAGNGVLWKPSENSTANSQMLHRLLIESGFLKDLVQLLTVEREAGARLVESDIDQLIFTGSAAVGRKIALRCAERMIPSTMELSGIDALFVLPDADLQLAAKAAWFGVTLNRGQTCLAVRRIFVQRDVLFNFMNVLGNHVESAQPMRLVMRSQVEHAQQLLTDAIARGGELLTPTHCDGWAMDAQTMVPQIIANATPEMAICTEECFAPIAAVLSFDTIDDALRQDQKCAFALGASIFTSDVIRGQQLAAQLRTGSVCINDVIAPTAHPATPFGGTGQSGWGITQGAEGLLAMTRPQVVSTRGGTFRPHFEGVGLELGQTLKGMLAWSHGSRWNQRWKGLWSMIQSFKAMGKNENNSPPQNKNAGV